MIPKKISIANTPTPIHKMDRLSEELKKNIYIKRDDFTGMEWSGNKIRKLEFAVKEALDQKCSVLITCGGTQSNHARATVAFARKLGLKVHLVLRGNAPDSLEGNMLLNELMGTAITWLDFEAFKYHEEVMKELGLKYAGEGKKAYIIPIGASNGIGNFGYYDCFNEILKQESDMNIHFDTIVCTVGSGGTYSGLMLGQLLNKTDHSIIGFNISNTSEYFKGVISEILSDSLDLIDEKSIKSQYSRDDIFIIDGYAGDGYAISRNEELEFILEIAQTEGIIFDPVYTGKAFRGLVDQIKRGNFEKSENILFIHTGGIFGAFSFENQIRTVLEK
jgi:D-cysteine desulfhydrase